MPKASEAPRRLGGSNKLISVQEPADQLGVSPNTVYREWRTWGLPGLKIGKHLRFRERDVEAWIDRRAA